MSGKASTAVATQHIRQTQFQLTIPFAYEFTSQMLGDEDRAAVLVSDVLVAANDTNGRIAFADMRLWILNQLYRRVVRFNSDPTNLLSVLAPEPRAAVIVHDVMGLDKSESASALGVSKERFAEVLHAARVGIRDHLSRLGLV